MNWINDQDEDEDEETVNTHKFYRVKIRRGGRESKLFLAVVWYILHYSLHCTPFYITSHYVYNLQSQPTSMKRSSLLRDLSKNSQTSYFHPYYMFILYVLLAHVLANSHLFTYNLYTICTFLSIFNIQGRYQNLHTRSYLI